MFALFSGLIGTAFSVLIRLELSGPGVQYIADNQLYNSIITAHAIVMIFFMVKFKNMLDSTSELVTTDKTVDNNDTDLSVGNGNNGNNASNNDNDNNKCSKYKYVNVFIKDPYNNRDIILRITKRQKGVYVWTTSDGKNKYVGHSINLYNRINSYFMPSILNTKARRVLRYLNKHGFTNVNLTVYIMEVESNLDEIVALEQHFIDTLNPNLNVDLIASSSGYHEPMAQEIRETLRKLRGTPIFVYEAETVCLLHIFDSKQYMYNMINIHHNTLNDCLDLGTLYLDYFFISLDNFELTNVKLITLDEIKDLVKTKRDIYKVKHPAAKAILAEFKDDPSKNLEMDSLNSLAKRLKGDREVIRDYLRGNKSGYYRGKWKFTYL
jgi:GIY-YIG catalytic domain/NUMOD1 domain